MQFSMTLHLGGDEGIRTPDLLLAKQALSQLSYIPTLWAREDSNLRPHAYQACALTSLSYEPDWVTHEWIAAPKENSLERR